MGQAAAPVIGAVFAAPDVWEGVKDISHGDFFTGLGTIGVAIIDVASQGLHATDEVIAVADALGAGVAKALLGKAAVPDDVPFCTGSIGLLGTKPSWDMMQDADTLLMVGSSFPYSEFLPKTGQVKAVQIDLLGRMLSIRYPMEVNLVGDSAETLRALLLLLDHRLRRPGRDVKPNRLSARRQCCMGHREAEGLRDSLGGGGGAEELASATGGRAGSASRLGRFLKGHHAVGESSPDALDFARVFALLWRERDAAGDEGAG